MKRNQHKKRPSPSDFEASAAWVRSQFARKGQARSALAHVNRCLDEVASYEHYFLLAKANLLGYLEEWDELTKLLQYLISASPNDPEILCQHAQFHMAHGRWQEALQYFRSAEKRLNGKAVPFLEGLYDEKIECLIGMDEIPQAKREAKRVLKKHPDFSVIQSRVDSLEAGTYQKPKPWA